MKFVVKVRRKFSRLLTSHVGVKQRRTLSLRLLSFFGNDLDSFMQSNGSPHVSLYWSRLSCMLFANDIALVADSRYKLQKQLDIIKDYETVRGNEL